MLSILYPTNRQGCYGVRILWRGIQAYVINMNNAYQGCTTVLSTYNVPANMLIGEEKYFNAYQNQVAFSWSAACNLWALFLLPKILKQYGILSVLLQTLCLFVQALFQLF